jgi:hypothetical protein
MSGQLDTAAYREGKFPEGELGFSRALRPLAAVGPLSASSECDEGTVPDAHTDIAAPLALHGSQAEPWVQLNLVIDSDVSMVLWERQCTELTEGFERSGVFRRIEVSQIRYEPSVRYAPPWADGSVPTALLPAGLTDSSGRTMTIVVSDGAAPAWRDGRMYAELERWARRGPSALLHVLPHSLWAGTGVTGDAWQVCVPRCGAGNAEWQVTHPFLPASAASFTGIPVPIIEATPAGVAAWATAMSSTGQVGRLRLWEPQPSAQPPDGPLSARTFTRIASPATVRLAAHLAAAAPTTVPVMRLIESSLSDPPGTAALAMVFMNLMQQVPCTQQPPGSSPWHRLFDVSAEAKDLLLGTVPLAELISVSNRVGERLDQLAGRSPDFPPWLARSAGLGAASPLAFFPPTLRALLGGDEPSTDGLDEEATGL